MSKPDPGKKRPGSAGGVTTPPPTAPTRPPPKKPKAVPLAEVVVEGVLPLNDAFVAAPVLSEHHMYHLEKAVRARSKAQVEAASASKMITSLTSRPPSGGGGPKFTPQVHALSHTTSLTANSAGLAASPMRSPSRERAAMGGTPAVPPPKRRERFVFQASEVCGSHPSLPQLRNPTFATAVAASKSEKLLAAQYPAMEASLLRTVAFYRTVHGMSLRIHEELSRNLRVNIADLALVERLLFEAWERDNDMASLLAVAQFTATVHGTGNSLAAGLGASMIATPGGMLSGGASVNGSSINGASVSGSMAYFADSAQKVLPPVSILVMFLWTCDTEDINDIFFGDDENHHSASSPAASATATQGNTEQSIKLMIASRVRAKIAEAVKRQNDMLEGSLSAHGASLRDGTGSAFDDGGVAEDFSRGSRNLNDLRLAFQNPKKNAYLVNKWVGTLAVLAATLERVREIIAPPPVVASSTTASSPMGTSMPHSPSMKTSNVPNSRPESGRSTKSAASAQSDGVEGRLPIRCRLMYNSPADALAALEQFAVHAPQGYPCPLPPLLSFTSSTTMIPSLPHSAVRRMEDYVAPNMEVDEEGNPRSVEDKLKLMCEGWYVRPKPPPEELTPEQQAEAAAVAAAAAAKGAKKAPEPAPAAKKPPTPSKKKRGGTPGGDLAPITAENEAQYLADLPKYITVELVVDHGTDHVVDLRNFSTNHPLDEEYLLAPLTQCRVHMIVPEQLKLCLRLINSAPLYPRTGEHVPMLMRPFVDRVLSDGRKSSAVAGKICNRLVNQFVKPHHCHRHPAQTYTAFCHECRQFICAACSKETHAAHHVEGISSVCHSIVQQKILPKVQQLKKKAELLRSLLGKLEGKRLVMGDLVDAGIDDVRERIIRRRELLHSDASSRSERQSQLLQGERELAETSLAAMQQTRTVIAAIRYGVVPSEPVHWKKFTAHQVLDYLSPRLPTQLVCSLIAVLTWSNPSKYLTNIIYPPESVHAGPNGGDVGQTTSADGGDIRSAMSSQGGAGFALHSRPSSRQSAHQSSVTIAVSHHDEDDNNPLHGTSITSPGIIEFNVESKSAFSFDGTAVGVVSGAVLSTTDLLTQTRLQRVDTELHPPTLEGYGKKEWTRTHQAKKKQFSNEAAYSFLTKVAEDVRKVEQFRKTAAARIKEKQSLQL